MSYFYLLTLCLAHLLTLSWGQDDPSSLNGGSVLAMAGAECVALAVDKRFGSGFQMVNISPRHVLIPHPHLAVAFTGLESDVQSLSLELSVQVSSKLGRGFLTTPSSNQNQRDARALISPRAMSQLTSHVLFNRRQSPYYVEPIVVGLERVLKQSTAKTTKTTSEDIIGEEKNILPQQEEQRIFHRPFLCTQDVIGSQARTDSFCCAGVASRSLYGTAEALWKPGMAPEELVAVCGKAFLSALERDCLSGYGARIFLITKDGIEEFDLACRND